MVKTHSCRKSRRRATSAGGMDQEAWSAGRSASTSSPNSEKSTLCSRSRASVRTAMSALSPTQKRGKIYNYRLGWILKDQGSEKAVLGIRDILVRIRISRFVPLTNGSRSGSRIRLLSLVTLRRKKKYSYFFLITYPQAHYLQSSTFNFLLKFFVQLLFCQHYFSPLNTFKRKGKDPDQQPDPDPDYCIRIREAQKRIPNTAKKPSSCVSDF
jgi:hypothetical protein